MDTVFEKLIICINLEIDYTKAPIPELFQEIFLSFTTS